jgi:phage/plasmid-associated DNA primase
VPFNQRFAANPDTELPSKLAGERTGIFAWMVRGALDWYEHGLGCPEAVAAATEGYREEMDTLGDFFEARCVLDPNATAPASALYKQYEMWCDDTGERQETQTAFGARLTERGFGSFRFTGGVNRGRKGWRGIGIQSTQPDPPDTGEPFTREQLPDNRSHPESSVSKPHSPGSAKSSEQYEPKNDINGLKQAREDITANSGSHYSHYSHSPANELWRDRQKDIDRALDALDDDKPVGGVAGQ